MNEFNITRKKKELDNKRVTRFQSYCKRSREKWFDEGKIFLTIESRNYVNKHIPELLKITNQFDILKQKMFLPNCIEKKEQNIDLKGIPDKLNT